MELVDFDLGAARAAIEACTSAASVLETAAGRLAGTAGCRLSGWAGASRIDFDGNAEDIAQILRTEAGHLDDTAEAIRQAILAAQAEEGRRRQAQLDEQRRIEQERLEQLERQDRARVGGPR